VWKLNTSKKIVLKQENNIFKNFGSSEYSEYVGNKG